MSTSVIHPGTTGATGPSGRLVGLVIAGLASAIALGFVFASNQADEVTQAAPVVRSVDQNTVWQSKIDFLTRQHQAQAARRPDTNIELYKLQTAGLVGTGNEITPAISPEAVKAIQARPEVNVPSILSAVPAPVFSPELARAQALNASRLQAMWSQRYQDLIDRFENQMVAQGQAVYAAPWPQGFQDLMNSYEAQLKALEHKSWPVGFQSLMDQYAAKVEEAEAAKMSRLDPILDRETNQEPVRLPREKRFGAH